MLNFLHEDSWIYTLLTQTRLIGIYRIYLGTVNNADNLKKLLRERYMHLRHTYCDKQHQHYYYSS